MMKKLFCLFAFFSLFGFLISGSVQADNLNQRAIFSINSEYEYLGRSNVPATLRKISDRAYWYVSDDYWNEISEPQRNSFLQKLNELAQEFDGRIYPVETNFWGPEPNPGIDNDPKITVFITRLVDYAGGYFDSSHLYRKAQIPESNEREMIFLNSISLINGRAKIFLAHEFQHLIALQQKDILRNATEDIWLNETRAEYAPRLLGYDDIYGASNIRRRVLAFQQNPSDPLGEWKNQSSDYGAVTLFMYYLVDNYGDRILLDTLKSDKTGIESFNEFLLLNNFTENFSDIFSNWTVTNVLNDETVNQKFVYKSENLDGFRISSNQSYGISGIDDIISISGSVKDWQPVWYEFSTPVNSGAGLNLKIEFSADSGTNFRIPYIAYKINGQKDFGFIALDGSSGSSFLKNFGSEIYKVVLIPANHSKISGFTEDDPASSFNLKVQLTAEFQEVSPLPAPQPPSAALSIQDLLDQIAVLQSQIARLKQEAVTQSEPPPVDVLSRNLFIGSAGDDVRWLQDFLIKEGVYPEARITGYFGALTRNAVIRFQKKYGISPQIGYVGAKTRTKINILLLN